MATRKQKAQGLLIGGGLTAGGLGALGFYYAPEVLMQLYWIPLIGILPGGWLGYKTAMRLGSPANTVIYTLRHRGRTVYVGVSYSRRIGVRIEEHRKSGKQFNRVRFSKPFPRKEALRIEARRIRRRKPKYNIAHAS